MREQKNQSVLRLAQDCSSSLAGINDISEFISENPSAMSARFESGEVLRDHTGDRQEFRPVSPTVTLSQGNATGSDSLYDPTEAEDFSRYSSSSEDFRYSSETLTAGGADRAYAPVGGRFPVKLSLYYPAGHFFLATRITEPLYGVQVNYRSYIPADAEITLRAGPHGDAPRLASLRLTGNSVSIWAANQSSLDLSQVAVSINAPGGRFGIGYGTLSFAVPVPVPDGDGRPAEFEWKHSLVPEVFSAHSAWKLKRKPALSEGETQSPEASGAGKSAEGETVATLSFKKDSRTKILTIRFEGSGATGDLGELWAAVTIMTSLAIYHHKPSTR
ncbi:hypothetical protein GGS24DRAFT_485849 [Hypoxylon argillaceum]|nr:hypothetical protein GGS24DRAFT_485849 [Hypoxylon argillaceum]